MDITNEWSPLLKSGNLSGLTSQSRRSPFINFLLVLTGVLLISYTVSLRFITSVFDGNVAPMEFSHMDQRVQAIVQPYIDRGATALVSLPVDCPKEIQDVLYVISYLCGDPPGTRIQTRLDLACGKTIYITCPTSCSYPSTCTPPAAKFGWEANIHHPRYEWSDQAGYCGAVSVTIAAQSFGIWLSQHFIRMFAGPSNLGMVTPGWGQELDHLNMAVTLRNLKLDIDEWPAYTTTNTTEYMMWMQQQLAQKHPLIWLVILRGDPNIVSPGIHYNHVEPVFGIYSNYSLDEYHAENVIVHASDWDQLHYYRTFESLPDAVPLDGNCRESQMQAGHNEAFPCIDIPGPNFGYALKGVRDPKGRTIHISLDVKNPNEPNVSVGMPAIWFHNPTVIGEEPLQIGRSYTLFRFDDNPAKLPDDSDFENADYTKRYDFTALTTSFSYTDSMPIRSDTGVWYILVEKL